MHTNHLHYRSQWFVREFWFRREEISMIIERYIAKFFYFFLKEYIAKFINSCVMDYMSTWTTSYIEQRFCKTP